jgi:ubiquinone/menaquinone biosynthesis C-methylase UbiE
MGLWNRIFAATYDRVSAGGERKVLGQARHDLLAGVLGRTLEIGAGTGANLEHYPAGTDVTLTEPDEAMAAQLRKKGGDVVPASADALPYEDGAFETVVATFVFCTVPDAHAALREVRRVLSPGGRLLFLEHVRGAPGSKHEHWQDRLERPWRAFACGCRCNRDFLSTLAAEGFVVEQLERPDWRFIPPLLRPVVVGSAAPKA